MKKGQGGRAIGRAKVRARTDRWLDFMVEQFDCWRSSGGNRQGATLPYIGIRAYNLEVLPRQYGRAFDSSDPRPNFQKVAPRSPGTGPCNEMGYWKRKGRSTDVWQFYMKKGVNATMTDVARRLRRKGERVSWCNAEGRVGGVRVRVRVCWGGG